MRGLAIVLALVGCFPEITSNPDGGAGSGGSSSGTGGHGGSGTGGSGGIGGSGGTGTGGTGGIGGNAGIGGIGGATGGSGGGGTGGSGGGGAAAPCTAQGNFGGLTMYECVPSGMDGRTAQPAPLVVALHGYTQGAYQTPASGQPQMPQWGMINTSQWATLAERYHFYVIFPDTGSGARSYYWYLSFYQQRGSLDAAAIANMVQTMQQRHNIDPNKIFVSGLSAGGMMTTLMLACYPDVFAGGATFEGGAFGCQQNCAALGRAGMGWTWPGNHPASLVTGCYPTVWNDANARKPRLLAFQGELDGAVTPENMADIVQQWTGALGIPATPANSALGIPTTLKGHDYTVYARGNQVMVATIFMHGIGHGTPVDPGGGTDQGGWDPMTSTTMVNDPNLVQDWTNTTGIYGPYYAAKFWGIIP